MAKYTLHEQAANKISKPRGLRSPMPWSPQITTSTPANPNSTQPQRQALTCSFKQKNAINTLNNGADCANTLDAAAVTHCCP